MTDPEFADRTYVEPITPEIVTRIIEVERPDALLPTLGGQTSLNVAIEVAERGVLREFGVELIGAKEDAIRRAEGREEFKRAMAEIGLEVPNSEVARSVEEAIRISHEISFPLILRPAYTLGGIGGGVVYNIEELEEQVRLGLSLSMVGEVLVEESVIGWKEFELEVMRDLKDNVVIICSIENFDPMGVHTGDSITVAPAQTLTDREYQQMRDAAIKVIRKIGVETGGSNIQFAVHPKTGRIVVIEMNPRVSRSSALASKATGYPIAKIAALLSVGYTLDELVNDITGTTPASFEPTIDYVVVKIPRWDFEKFPDADRTLTTAMKSIGEVMAIGKTFKEALQKGIRSLEQRRYGFGADGNELEQAVGHAAFKGVIYARDHHFLPELTYAGIEAHHTNNLIYTRSDEPNFFVDISGTIGKKIKSINAHKSQIHNPRETERRVRIRAEEAGAVVGLPMAENFTIKRLR